MNLPQILLLPSSKVYQHYSNPTPGLRALKNAHMPPVRARHTHPEFCVIKTLPGCCQCSSCVVSRTLNWKKPPQSNILYCYEDSLTRPEQIQDQLLSSFGCGWDFKQMWMRSSLCHLTFGPGISPWSSFIWHDCLEFEASFYHLKHFQK